MGCNTICDLPDSLLTQILLNLPTKDSVKTSVISTRWRNLWLSVPGLDLATRHFRCGEVFARFIDRFMEFNNHKSRLQNFKLVQYYHFDRVNELLGTVVDRGIQHLEVTINTAHRFVLMHQNIYKSNTLVSLKLDYVELTNPEFVVSLPCLKIINLFNCYGKDGPLIVEKLISGCHVLEDLQLIRPFHILDEKVVLYLRVRSQTLKRCRLGFALNYSGRGDLKVEFDAPRLEYLNLSEIQSDKIVVKNLSSLLRFDIDTKINLKYDSPIQPEDLRNRDFLTGISNVRRMIICEWTLQVLSCYSKVGSIPKLHNLYHLQAPFYSTSLQLLSAFLESCPNLKSLTLLDCSFTVEPEQIDYTNVPRCLISTLVYVKINIWMMGDAIKLVNYFLENSAVLKKLTLSFAPYSITKQEVESYKKLLTSTKLSRTCEVIIDEKIYKVRCQTR